MTDIAKINLNFGDAIEAIKNGKTVARSGWNGKGMYIGLQRGYVDPNRLGGKGMEHPSYPHGTTIDGVDLGLFNWGDDGITIHMPSIYMMTATGTIVTGWLASQTDMLAEDWQVSE